MKIKEKERVVSVYVTCSNWEKVRRTAFHANRSMKSVVHDALEQYFTKESHEADGEKVESGE